MIDATSSLLDVAFATCTALHDAGIEAILCGGSAATYYTSDYQSQDADFVLRVAVNGKAIDGALATIGFARSRSNVYSHPSSSFTVEFPPGPLTIGRKILTQWRTTRRDSDILHVIEPEDCVCDRFLHFWAWRDRSAREAALSVARADSALDLSAIDAWAENELTIDPLYDRGTWEKFRGELMAQRR